MFESLFTALAPRSVLVCWADKSSDEDLALPAGTMATSCELDEIADTDLADVDLIWLRGFPSWHAVRALATRLERRRATHGGALPVVFVEGGPIDPVPTWSTNAAYAAHLTRLESSKDGVRSALEGFARRLDPESTLLSWTPGRGAWALLPSTIAVELASWLAGRAVLFETLSAVHRDQAELVARNFALFELLESSQRTGTAVVRSTRFRLGTRVVRLGRQLTRKEGFFNAPGQILKRQKAVDTWRARLAADRPVQELAPEIGALRVTYVLPELRLSGGALVVLQVVNELRLLGVDARYRDVEGPRGCTPGPPARRTHAVRFRSGHVAAVPDGRRGRRDPLEHCVIGPPARRFGTWSIRGLLHPRLRGLVLSRERYADACPGRADLRADPESDRDLGVAPGSPRPRPISRAQARARIGSRVLLSAHASALAYETSGRAGNGAPAHSSTRFRHGGRDAGEGPPGEAGRRDRPLRREDRRPFAAVPLSGCRRRD